MRKKTDKQRAREAELARIYARDGCVKPSTLFKESVAPDAPFHDVFEWDREKCFLEHNLAIARRAIRITIHQDTDGRFSKFANVPQTIEVTIIEKREDMDSEGRYVPTSVLVAKDDADLKASVAGLLRRLRGVETELSEFYGEAYACGKTEMARDFDHALNGIQAAIKRVGYHAGDPQDARPLKQETGGPSHLQH